MQDALCKAPSSPSAPLCDLLVWETLLHPSMCPSSKVSSSENMNGFVTGRTESLPADSSGIVNMSSPSGSSDSSSSAKVQRPPPPYKGIPSLGKPAAMHANSLQEPRPTTNADIFLSQFQAQMSQMKSAMDAVQNEILLHTSKGGGGRGGGGGSRRGRTKVPGSLAASVRYHSQISTSNGLKLKIKKSPKPNRKKAGRGRKGRGKRKKDDEDDEDMSDGDEAHVNSTKGGGDMRVENHDESAVLGAPCGWGDSLPEDVLSRIFSHAVRVEDGCIPLLVRLSKVSRLWWQTASRPELWTSVDLSSSRVKDKFKIERNLVYFLEHRFSHVKHLNLGGWSSAITNFSIDVLVRCCKDLESLGLSSCQKLTSQNLKTITESLENLKKLDLSSISTTYNTKTAVSPTAITEAAEELGARLTHISLANNCLANCPQMVTSLADYCPSLEALDLSNVTSPRRDSIVINVEHLQQGCQKLRILRLTNSDFILSETSLKEQVSSPGFPNLEELSIAVDPKRNQGMDESDLERIVKGGNKLRLLDVRGCSRIGDSGLVRIPAWDLEHLYLSGCFATKSSNDGLELVARKWRHSFKEIDFSWTPGEDTINSAIKALAESDDENETLPLKFLDLCGSSVSFDSVKVALKTCVHLERLNLTSCRALPRGIKRNYQSAHEVAALREQVLSGKFDDHPDD